MTANKFGRSIMGKLVTDKQAMRVNGKKALVYRLKNLL
jgi:hypothetical protein